MYAPVAQLDRVTGYEPVGQGFESLPAYQDSRCPFGCLLFFFIDTSEELSYNICVEITEEVLIMGNFSYDVNTIRQYLADSQVLEFGIDYYQCEDPNRTPKEASVLAYAYVERYCQKWCSRDRKDPATRHQRAFDSFVQKVNEKQYFYSTRPTRLLD